MSGENKKTILLVEDEIIIAMAAKMSLEKYGYNVVTINTGEKAIQVITKDAVELMILPESKQSSLEKFGYNVILVNTAEKAVEVFKDHSEIDLVLMDIDLGEGMDGTQAAEIILKKRDIPILFLSNHTEPEIVEKTEKITSYGYVVKNSGITVLDASIKMAFKLFDANTKLRNELIIKEKRAAELVIANKELAFQNEEKEKRAAELIITNKELAFQKEEKELLLREIHHRVKNNISSIESLLLMQSQYISNPEAISVLNDTIVRINSVRVLYELLLISDDFRNISTKKYLENLIHSFVSLFHNNFAITYTKQIDEFSLSSKKMFYLGIIINELQTNILKYAFKGRDSGLINISLENIKNTVTLTIQDNGTGLPESFNDSKSNTFGLILVKNLSEQLGGTFTIENHDGTRSIVKFDI